VQLTRAPGLRVLALACAACALFALADSAHAQSSAILTIDSDYRFRGVPIGGNRLSIRAEVAYEGAQGWYGGASGTRAQFAKGDRYFAITAYGGRIVTIGPSVDLDLGATAWRFSGDDYNFAEVYAGIVARSWSLRVNFSPDYFGRSVRTIYLDASADRQLTDTIRIFVHAGELVANAAPRPDNADTACFAAPLTPSPHCPTTPSTGRSRWDVRAGVGWNVRSNIDAQFTWTTVGSGGPFPAAGDLRRSGPAAAVLVSF
jgi:uncharacterized protein (TIGR02001 family)